MPRRLRVQGIGLVAAACLSLAAPAGAATTTLVPTGSGLTLPAGVIRDNTGALWVSDALRGVCKVDTTLAGGTALIDDGTFCTTAAAAHPVEPPAGAPPAPIVPPTRPTATFQLAFDPATSMMYVAEGSSAGSGVWKFHLEGATPEASHIASATKIINEADRVFGLAIGENTGGTPVLDYTTKRSPVIRRVLNPATCDPCSPLGAGSSLGGALALANLNGVLYIAEELSGVTKLENPGLAGGIAAPVPGFPGGLPSTIAADNARGRVYAGTTNGNNLDQVDVLDAATGQVETYALGMTGVTALFAAPDGELVVGDDAAIGAETEGNGRLLSVGLEVLGRPHAVITDGPASFINGAGGTFTFTGPAGSSLECRLDPAGAADPWTPCPSGSFDTGAVSEGIHAFEVRAVSPDPAIGAGPIQRRTFVSDHTAPQVTIDNSAADRTLVGATALTMRFSSSDPTSAFACSLDGAAPVPCSDPRRLTRLGLGDHVFAVTATDAAGNASAPAVFSFTVSPAPAAGAAEQPSTERSSAPSGALVARLSPALRPGTLRLLRSRSTLKKLRSHRRVVARLVAPDVARVAIIALWRTSAKKPRAGRAPVAMATLQLPASGRQDVALTLTRSQAAKLKAGRYLVGVVLTDGAQRYGPSRYRRLVLLGR